MPVLPSHPFLPMPVRAPHRIAAKQGWRTPVQAAVLLALSPTLAYATCTATGTFVTSICDSGAGNTVHFTSDASSSVSVLTVTDHTAKSVALTVAENLLSAGPPPIYDTTGGPYNQTLNIQGATTLTTPDYSSVISQSYKADRNISVTVDPMVQISSTDGFGGVWVRNDTSGHIVVDSAGIIETFSPGSNSPDGINAVTNLGNATLTNRGAVTSHGYRGLYAENGDSNNAAPVPFTASITNTAGAVVQAYLAGARAINYYGLASIDNQGIIASTTRQGLVAWSPLGSVEITNSGTVTADDDHAIQAATDNGAITVTNSGTLTAHNNPAIPDVGGRALPLYSAIHAAADTSGNVTVTNQVGGQINAPDDYGIHAETTLGTVTVNNSAAITGASGISTKASGAVDITNSGSISAAGPSGTGIYVASASGGTLSNSGTLTGAGVALQTDSAALLAQISNQSTGTISGALHINGSTAVQNAGVLSLPANTTSTIAGSYAQGIAASTGTVRTHINASAQFGKLQVSGPATLPAGSKIDVVTGDAASCRNLGTGSTIPGVITSTNLSASTFVVTDDCSNVDFEAVINGNAVDLHAVTRVDGACGTAANLAALFKPAANLCAEGTASAVQEGNPWTWTCSGAAGGAAASCSAPNAPTGSGSGDGRASVSGNQWVVDEVASGGFIPLTGHPKSPSIAPPPNLIFPHGLFDIRLISGDPGTSATVTLTYPAALPPGTVWMKYGRTNANPSPHWYPYPGAVIAGNTVTLTLTDGGAGDDDLAQNRVIIDPSGPAYAPANNIPTLSQWGLMLLASLLALVSGRRLRRPQAR